MDDLARRTRIPVAHVAALEADRPEDLPAGPYAEAYLRALYDELAIEGGEEVVQPEDPAPDRVPLQVVRIVAAMSVVSLLALIGSQGWSRYAETQAEAAALAPPPAPDQVVRVVARRTTRLTVRVDDALVLERAVSGGEDLTFAAHHRVDLDIAAADALRIEHNGRSIVPLGRQDAPRRLVFLDDLERSP